MGPSPAHWGISWTVAWKLSRVAAVFPGASRMLFPARLCLLHGKTTPFSSWSCVFLVTQVPNPLAELCSWLVPLPSSVLIWAWGAEKCQAASGGLGLVTSIVFFCTQHIWVVLSVPHWEGNKVRRKGRNSWDRGLFHEIFFFTPRCFFQSYKWNIRRVRSTNEKHIKYSRLPDLIIEIFSVTRRATWCVLLSIQNKTNNHCSSNALKYTVLCQVTHFAITEMFKGFKNQMELCIEFGYLSKNLSCN